MIWPFCRRQPVHVGPTSVDWKPGDMAECVSSTWRAPTPSDPRAGQKFMVRDVRYAIGDGGGVSCFFLFFVGDVATAYDSRGFRKIILTDTGADRTVGKRVPVRAKVDA